MIAVLLFSLLFQIPESVTREPSAEKRYQLALDHAENLLITATDADRKSRMNQAAEATEFALKSLEDMGKPPYRNARNYKKMELRTRAILRRAEAHLEAASIDERPSLQPALDRINAIHEKVLQGVMSKKP